MEEQYNLSGLAAVMDNRLTINKGISFEYNEIRMLEPLITRDVSESVEMMGNSLEGLEYAAKTASSVDDKIARAMKEFENQTDSGQGKEFDSAAELMGLKDLIRYTQICDHNQIIDTTKETIDALEKRGYTLSCIKNYFLNPYPDTNYRGMHLNFISPYGQEIEVQVHSAFSFAVKQEGHKEYETVRSVGSNEAERKKAMERVCKIHDKVPTPPKVDEIQGYKIAPTVKIAIQQKRRAETQIRIDVYEDKESRSSAKTYSISKDGERLSSGFELTFTDGSAWVYQNIKDETPQKYTINKAGDVINKQAAIPLELTIPQLKRLAERQEESYRQYEKKIEEMKAQGMTNALKDKKEEKSVSTVKSGGER